MNKIKLFCFPYAGGSAFVYNAWKKLLGPMLELRAVELAGRGIRISEPVYESFEAMINDLFQTIKPELRSGRYALFGHSLGAAVCYQLIERIKEEGLPKPMHVFFSGRGAPHIPKKNKKTYHLMGAEEFKREIFNLGGTPKEFFEHPELAELLLPVLKNDFKMAHEFKAHSDICRYDGDITVFLGKEDEATPEQNDGWKDYTSQACQVIYFNGGHFFLNGEMERMAAYIKMALMNTHH